MSLIFYPKTFVTVTEIITSSSAITERPHCRVGWLWPKVEDWNWETTFTDIIDLY